MVSKNQTQTIYFPADKLPLMDRVLARAKRTKRSVSYTVVEMLEEAEAASSTNNKEA